MKNTFQRTTAVAGGVIALALLTACASREAPLKPLEDARAAVERATTNPIVVQRAPLELKAASDTLAKAQRAWSQEADTAEATHQANLATQRADIATNTARARQLDDDIKKAGNDAERLRLQGDASRARLQAEQARSQADQARTAAAASAQTAQAAQQQALSAEQRAAANEARVKQLQSELKDLQAQQTERGLLVTLGDVLFEFGKSELTSQAAPRLDKLAEFLREFPNRKLLIEGHTDSVGSDSFNVNLSQQRAEAVQRALATRGVAADRITTSGYGKAFPVADNGSPEGRAMNRRVEIVIADENGNLRARR